VGTGLVVCGAPLDLEELLEGVLRLPDHRRRGGGAPFSRGCRGGEEPCQDPNFLDMGEIGRSSDWLRKNKEINLKT
jgi:hypothetical protein